MENTAFYIKYPPHHPVKVETHFNGEKSRKRPLTEVGDLIAACTSEPTRRLLGLPEKYGPLSLHSFNNEAETSYNSWDPLTVLGENGTTGTSPLIIKSLNDSQQEMEVDSSSTSTDSYIKIDGIGRRVSEKEAKIANPYTKRLRSSWTLKPNVPTLDYEANSCLFLLDSEYLENSGLPSDKLILYCRDTFHKQMKFLQDKVIKQSRLGWILGPPGTGKSTTTLAFASTLDRNDWVITWIHLSRRKYPVCVRLDISSKRTRNIEDTDISQLNDILYDMDENKNHIVIVDGYVNIKEHIDVEKACMQWLEKDLQKRRLVFVCSMTARFKVKLHEDKLDNVENFFVCSWKLEEYQSAIMEDDFFHNIKKYLDSKCSLDSNFHPEAEPETRADLVISKFYFAGGSSRYMFNFLTADVIELIDESIAEVENVLSYIKGSVGDRSNGVINRLFGCFITSENTRRASIISQFAASQLALKEGPSLIQSLVEVLHRDRNPAMDGWLLEMWFFASIRSGGVKLRMKDGVENCWTEAAVETFDPDNVPKNLPNNGIWLKPMKWNQGGYDAVYVNKDKKVIRFIQVTRGMTHSFKIQYFNSLLWKFAEYFETATLEIYFLVPEQQEKIFKINSVFGCGLLAAFQDWKICEEVDQIKIAGVIGFQRK